jgi:hypothetical protein
LPIQEIWILPAMSSKTKPSPLSVKLLKTGKRHTLLNMWRTPY